MRHFLTFIFALYSCVSYGQNFSYPSIKATGQRINDFVPAGWTVLDSAYGDLNKDAIKDAAIIIQHKDSVVLVNGPEDTVITQPRMLLILLQKPVENGFALAEQSNSFIMKHDNPSMDDPYKKMAIKNGILEIKYYLFYTMGSWYVTNAAYKFRYQEGQFCLIGADNYSFHRATEDFENYSYNFLTKKRILTKGNEHKATRKTTMKPVKIPQLKTLKTLTEPFTWEVEPNVFL